MFTGWSLIHLPYEGLVPFTPIPLTDRDTLTGPLSCDPQRWFSGGCPIPAGEGAVIGYHGPDCGGRLVREKGEGYFCLACAEVGHEFKGTIPGSVATFDDWRTHRDEIARTSAFVGSVCRVREPLAPAEEGATGGGGTE